MKLFHRKTEQPWEVVDRKTVAAIVVYNEHEIDELDVARIFDATMFGKYTFEIRGHHLDARDIRRALVFARQLLLQDAARQGFNVLLTEGWSVTHLRQGKRHRAEVQYFGRPAHALGKVPAARPPPFLALLEAHR